MREGSMAGEATPLSREPEARDTAQVPAAGRKTVAEDLLAAIHIEQLEANGVLPRARFAELADDQVVDTEHAPVLELHHVGAGRVRHQVAVRQGLETAAAAEVG